MIRYRINRIKQTKTFMYNLLIPCINLKPMVWAIFHMFWGFNCLNYIMLLFSYFHKMPVLPNGCRVGFSRLRDFNSNIFNTLDTIRLVFAMYDICINEDPLAPEWCLVMDMTGFSMGHLTKLTNLTLMKKCLNYVQVSTQYIIKIDIF